VRTFYGFFLFCLTVYLIWRRQAQRRREHHGHPTSARDWFLYIAISVVLVLGVVLYAFTK
jgi:nitrate reductase gamma subunit